jgi:pSer/pThr/pTyr-binding forkhead associated (FHA) protein
MFDQPTVVIPALEPRSEPEELAAARARIAQEGESGQFVGYETDDGFSVVRIADGWSRIGRSPSADIQLDDPTVSRRHALLVRRPEGELSVLDDRSLNGVFVNGERTDWSELTDGDELAIGRYRLHVIAT